MQPSPLRYEDREQLLSIRPAIASIRLAGLYVEGCLDALTAPTVALVGTRAPSSGGRALARQTAQALAQAGVCIVSGLAHGIDAAAHEGAVAAGAPTIGVLGGGHAHFYPPRNRPLAETMLAAGGAVVSPFAPETPARPSQFLARNGVIAALADAVVVVEAAARSGSLNTAGWAADAGTPVFAFPGDVDRPKAAGCLALIRDGATLVRDADDILEGLGLPRSGDVPTPAPPRAQEPLEVALLTRLASGEASLDDLAVAIAQPAAALAAALVRLELQGHVQNREGLRFALARRPG